MGVKTPGKFIILEVLVEQSDLYMLLSHFQCPL